MMKKYTEEELKQIFKNRSNCYANSDEVIMAMDEDRFIEVLKELKILPIQRVNYLLPDNKCDYTGNFCKGDSYNENSPICLKCEGNCS